ncbi:MAG: hypothetical protein Tsb009_20150 [Planctomycetaceae bacterium]
MQIAHYDIVRLKWSHRFLENHAESQNADMTFQSGRTTTKMCRLDKVFELQWRES